MNIIIVGNGQVGYNLASHLSQEGNNVVIIDKDVNVLKKADEALDVMCIRGNGLRTSVLIEAGVKNTDLIIAVTSRDEINMLCCLTAKRLGARRTIARIRDPEYTYELSMLKKEMGLDMVINPEQEAAAEIVRLLKFPTAINIETFVHGKVELVAFKIFETDPIVGKNLASVMIDYPFSVLFCIAVRQDEIIIPNGDFIVYKDDIIYIIGMSSEIVRFFKAMGRYQQKVKNAMIIGGGLITHYICDSITAMGINVKIFETDYDRCVDLNENFPRCLIINADGTDEDILNSENIMDMDAFITLTSRDEENLMTSLYANHIGVSKVITKINKVNYTNIMSNIGIDSIISPKDITSYQIIRFVRALKNSIGNNIERMYKIVDQRAEALEFIARNTTKFLNIPFKDVNFKNGFLVAAIVRNKEIIIPSGSDYISENDRVIIITKIENINDLNDVFVNGG